MKYREFYILLKNQNPSIEARVKYPLGEKNGENNFCSGKQNSVNENNLMFSDKRLTGWRW